MPIPAARLKLLVLFIGLTVLVLAAEPAVRLLDERFALQVPSALDGPGWILIAAGALSIFSAEYELLTQGDATGAPGDPPSRLVDRGIYRFVRNPIYMGAEVELLGVALVRSSIAYLAIAVVFALSIHLFVVHVEEPRTERRLGESYTRYRNRTSRWLPRLS